MSYTPHTWVDNETITASKLNNIEDGVQEAAQSGGGYDAEFTIYHSANSADDYVFTRVSGDFATLTSMYENHTPPVILVRIDDSFAYVCTATTNVSLYNQTASYLVFFVQGTTCVTAPNVPFHTYAYINWNSDNTITMD